MTNFKTFLEKGLESAKEAERAKQEISDVFAEMRRQTLEATKGKIEIKIVEHNAVGDFSVGLSISEIVSGTYKAVDAISTKDKNIWSTLARWKMPENGYPCTISFDSQRIDCADKDGLVDALSAMLASPSVGRKIHSILVGNTP